MNDNFNNFKIVGSVSMGGHTLNVHNSMEYPLFMVSHLEIILEQEINKSVLDGFALKGLSYVCPEGEFTAPGVYITPPAVYDILMSYRMDCRKLDFLRRKFGYYMAEIVATQTSNAVLEEYRSFEGKGSE